MSKLNEIRDMVDKIDDAELLEAGQGLLRDLITIENYKSKISELEKNLTTGGRSIFFFFTSGLEGEELAFAAERISGKLKRMDRKAK
jgi:hypothetical protein